MSADSSDVTKVYEQAKAGAFDKVNAAFDADFVLAGAAARFIKASSGWTILHQAAFWGSRAGVRHAIAFGAPVQHRCVKGQTAADVARSKGFNELAQWIDDSRPGQSDLWAVVSDPLMRPSSSFFSCQPTRVQADRDFTVAYGGGVVHVKKGATFFEDDYGRVLVGWHGTFSPPCGMDGNPLISSS